MGVLEGHDNPSKQNRSMIGLRLSCLSPFARSAVMLPAFSAPLIQVRFVSLKKTKQRIHASKNIEKITKAMKNVASARMKSAETEAKASQHFIAGLNNYFGVLPAVVRGNANHIILPITSDRGLCGAVNTNCVRNVKLDIKEDAKNGKDLFQLVIIGSKGKDQLNRFYSKEIAFVFDEIQKKPVTFAQACALADEILLQKFETMTIYFTRFVNTGTQIPDKMTLYSPAKVDEFADQLDEYECEPDKNEIMEAMYTFYFASNLYYTMCTAIASEQASRMVAMDGASRNAREMIQKLTILYNRTRQSIITGQLIEITSAAESLK
eukprot:c2911_g1_i2.p1 GENE.c2911_g1_i2~~c2911_g1_i2.p1  ORF type:complete len:322 (+),score=86.10 c2911_g1_i2:1-966(+)